MSDQATVSIQATLEALVRRIVEAVHPVRIILFGSAARGEVGPDGDVDILVVMPEGTPALETAQFLHTQLFGIPLSVDILVATAEDLRRHRDNIGLIYRTILREGKELYAAWRRLASARLTVYATVLRYPSGQGAATQVQFAEELGSGGAATEPADRPNLVLSDDKGKVRAMLGLLPDGSPGLALRDGTGEAIWSAP